jgi:hypothetical protein
MARNLPAEADGWVACGGAIRPVVAGIVACPRGPVTVRSCLFCHLQEYSSQERSPGGWCDAESELQPGSRDLDDEQDVSGAARVKHDHRVEI